eukprot:5992376-Amphidinium_carterae.2
MYCTSSRDGNRNELTWPPSQYATPSVRALAFLVLGGLSRKAIRLAMSCFATALANHVLDFAVLDTLLIAFPLAAFRCFFHHPFPFLFPYPSKSPKNEAAKVLVLPIAVENTSLGQQDQHRRVAMRIVSE